MADAKSIADTLAGMFSGKPTPAASPAPSVDQAPGEAQAGSSCPTCGGPAPGTKMHDAFKSIRNAFGNQ